MEFINYLKTEWAVIIQAPLTFIVGAIIVGTLVYGLARLQFSDRISSMNGRIELKDDRIADYEAKLDGATPEEAQARIAALEEKVAGLGPKLYPHDELKKLFDIVRLHPGTVTITKDGGTIESSRLQKQLAELFVEAKWQVYEGMAIGNPPQSGLRVMTYCEDGLDRYSKAIVDGFAATTIPHESTNSDPLMSATPGVKETTPTILVSVPL